MGTFLLLATAASEAASGMAEAAEEGGFGLNLDILETNLVNLTIVIVLVFYFGRSFLGKILSERRSTIEAAIQEAERRKKEAAIALADQQQKLAQAQAEAEKIRSQAEESARAAREAILAKSAQDLERMREAATQDLNTEQERIITELRQRAVAMALQRVESELPSRLNDSVQQQLIDRSISMLGV